MGSRKAELLGTQWRGVGEERTLESFTFATESRKYLVPVGAVVEARNHTPRTRTVRGIEGEIGEDARVVFADGGKKPRLSSVAVDYDLELHQLDGEAPLPTPRPARPRAQEPAAGGDGEVVEDGTAPEPPTDPALMLFRGTAIRVRGERGAEEMCLTDMWRANAPTTKKAPSDWLKLESTIAFLEHLEETLPGGFLENGGKLHVAEAGNPRAGVGGATWAHWQLAFAYAKYLSPPFHAWVNQAAREKMIGQAKPAPAVATDPAIIALLQGQQALMARLADGKADRAEVGAVDEKADRAVEDAAAARIAADEAIAIAEEARDAARAATEPPPPGMRVRRDGAEVYGGAVPGSMAAVQCAARQGMPERGTACTHWVKLAIATGAVADPEATVLDQKHRADGRRWMPKALEYTETAAKVYLRRLRSQGYDVVNGLVVQTREVTVSARQAADEALRAATMRPSGDGQQTIPGVENDTTSKAS